MSIVLEQQKNLCNQMLLQKFSHCLHYLHTHNRTDLTWCRHWFIKDSDLANGKTIKFSAGVALYVHTSRYAVHVTVDLYVVVISSEDSFSTTNPKSQTHGNSQCLVGTSNSICSCKSQSHLGSLVWSYPGLTIFFNMHKKIVEAQVCMYAHAVRYTVKPRPRS